MTLESGGLELNQVDIIITALFKFPGKVLRNYYPIWYSLRMLCRKSD